MQEMSKLISDVLRIRAASLITLFGSNCVEKSHFYVDRVSRFHFNKGKLHLVGKTSVFGNQLETLYLAPHTPPICPCFTPWGSSKYLKDVKSTNV